MWIVCCFLRSDMTQLFEALYKRMVARDRLDASIRMYKVSAAITHMCNRNLLSHDQRCGESSSAPRCFLLDSALRVANSRLHNFLERLLHHIGFDVEEVWMKFLNNVSRHTSDGGIACHFAELMTAHPIGNDIKTKGKISRVACHGSSQRKDAILIQLALFANRLTTTGN